MKKINIKWTIEGLYKNYKAIEYPEFQREPSVWDLDKQRKLIDSMLRKFDIASIYLYKRDDGIYECIDGRQRLSTILSFLGLSEGKKEDDDRNNYNNNFKFISDDELLGRKSLEKYDNKTWREFSPRQQSDFLQYEFNVVEITDIDKDDEELNLMFLRLQLGSALNAGEKLNAMLGDMKEFIFNKLGKHKYFEFLHIPKNRYSKELTAAQIAINFFSLKTNSTFERARFLDLQEFFKKYLKFSSVDETTATLLKKRLDTVYDYVKDSKLDLRNRAIGVSVFFFLNNLIDKGHEQNIKPFLKFLNEFLKKLKSEIKKGYDIDPRYRYLIEFQTYISQAAVEKYAIENRQKYLEDYFNYYLTNTGKLKGDK